MAATSTACRQEPADAAAARVFGAGLGIGVLGLAYSTVVLVRLVESWRITPTTSSNHLAILGLGFTYPAANPGALVILLLALLALIATVRAAWRVGVEALADHRLRHRLELDRCAEIDGAHVIEDGRPLAFCAGLLRPRIYVSTATLTLLDEAAVAAVLAHERHHRRRRDPLRAACGRVLADSLFFVPGLGELSRRQRALAELGADERAMRGMSDGRSALARAMLGFADESSTPGQVGFDAVRVDYLLGAAPDWGFPALVCIVAVGVIILLLAVTLLVGRIAAGSASLALPFLSRQPCVLTLATIGAMLVFGAVRVARH